jgi:ubiquinone/menaquinone biosynthesis C-methylase UbiE
MDRATWLREQRLRAEADYDSRYSATYDADAEPMTSTHRRFARRVVRASPVGGTVLDAACGTGKYFGVVLSAGRKVVGVDQSTGMLDQARAKFPTAELIHSSLQELDLEPAFDGVMCVDAMENVPPEDWPAVLANLHRVLRPEGLLYLTVEEHDQADIDRAYADGAARGLPVVRGEFLFHGSDYHFVPAREQVAEWIAGEGLSVFEEADSPGDGFSYWHLLMR